MIPRMRARILSAEGLEAGALGAGVSLESAGVLEPERDERVIKR